MNGASQPGAAVPRIFLLVSNTRAIVGKRRA